MRFNAILDRSVKVTTLLGSIALMIPLTISLISDAQFGHLPLWLGVLFALLYVFIFLIHPNSFEIRNSQIVIHRPLKNKTIDFSAIAKISILAPEMLRGSYRLFGVGGLWGNFGLFSNRSLGEFQAYTTGFEHGVLIELLDGKKIVISPEHADQFVQMVAVKG